MEPQSFLVEPSFGELELTYNNVKLGGVLFTVCCLHLLFFILSVLIEISVL